MDPNNAKAQLYYININKKWINSILNCEAYSFGGGIILVKIHRNLCYDLSSLTTRDISNKYTVTVRNKFDTYQEIWFDTLQKISETHTPYDEYENFLTDKMEAAAEYIPTKPNVKFYVSY